MKFVLVFWCDVWVFEFLDNQVVDDEITYSIYVYMYTLLICSNWYKLVLLLLIMMNSRVNEVVLEFDMLLLLICTMSIPFCEVVVWIAEVWVKLFMWRTKMNLRFMRLLTELLIWLRELNLVDFLFSCWGCVSRVVWEKTGFSCEISIFKRFLNKWLCEVFENDFWDGWNLNFSVDYDRAKCQEHVGENGIKIRLTVWILCAKWWKQKNEEKVVLSDEHGRACAWHGPCVHSAFFGTAVGVHDTGRACCQDFGFRVFLCFFTHFCFWIGLWCKHESFR